MSTAANSIIIELKCHPQYSMGILETRELALPCLARPSKLWAQRGAAGCSDWRRRETDREEREKDRDRDIVGFCCVIRFVWGQQTKVQNCPTLHSLSFALLLFHEMRCHAM